MHSPQSEFRRGFAHLSILAAACLNALSSNAAVVPPTDNTAQPYFGTYAGGLYGNSGSGSGISYATFARNWLYRSSVFLETGGSYTNWAHIEGESGFLGSLQRWKAQNPDSTICLMLCMFPSGNSLAVGARPAANNLDANPSNDNYDAHFVSLANRLVSRGLADKIILRVGHEFTVSSGAQKWFPWQAQTLTEAQNYAAYYRNIVNAIRSVPGTENIKFSWCGMNRTIPGYQLIDAYPGDAYVDYIGVDIYDVTGAANTYPYGPPLTDAQRRINAWTVLSGTSGNGLAAWRNFAASRGKPFVIPEWGCARTQDGSGKGGGDNTYFVQKMYDFIHETSNNVYYHTYFDDVDKHRLVPAPAYPPLDHVNASALFHKLFGVPAFPAATDIGTVGLAGSTRAVEIKGGGAGYVAGGTSDNFRLSSRAVSGDDSLVLQVFGKSSAAVAQSGVMVRQSTAANAPYAALFLANGNLVFQSRRSAGAAALEQSITTSVSLPAWLKITRQGNVIAGYHSTDGLNWSFIAAQTIAMTGSVQVGLAVSSGDTTTLNTTSIDDVDAVDLDSSLTANINNPIILDNAAPSGVSILGPWITATDFPTYEGVDYLHDGNANKGSCTVQFTPQVPTSAQYDVYTRWNAIYKRADNVPYTVTAASGVVNLLANQVVGRRQWIHLGTHRFNAGTAGNVTIGNAGTSFLTVADAIMLVPVPAGWAPNFTLFQEPLNGTNFTAGYGAISATIVGTDAGHTPYEGTEQYKFAYTSGSLGFRMNFVTRDLSQATHLRLARKGPLLNSTHNLGVRLVQSSGALGARYNVARTTGYQVIDIPIASLSGGVDLSQITGVYFYPGSTTAGQSDTMYVDNIVFIRKF